MANNNDKFISRENAKTLWGYMIDLLTGKQNKLTFDDTPTQGSDNPVKSGGIFTALAGKGTYSKPQNGIPKTDLENAVQTSLGLADSALQSETDPTVPSWAKQTNKPSYTQDEVPDGTTYKRVTQTEKDAWSGKQNALTTTQMQAVNSGITSAGVAQISTNQSNILYALGKTGRNHFNLDISVVKNWNTSGTWNGNVYTQGGLTFTFNSDGTIDVSGTATEKVSLVLDVYYPLNTEIGYRFHDIDGLVLSGCPTGGAWNRYSLSIQMTDSPWTGAANDTGSGATIDNSALPSNTALVAFYLTIYASYPTSSFTFKPMFCTQEDWSIAHDYTPYRGVPNYDLTRLEAEDRASLAEVVDSGAKQLAQGQNNSGSAGTATIQSDGYTVKLTGSAASSSSLSFATTGTIQKTGTYVFAIEASGTMDRISIWDNTASASVETLYATGSKEVTLTAGHSYALFHFAGSAMTLNATVKYMICTKAAFGVSQKFVPYQWETTDITNTYTSSSTWTYFDKDNTTCKLYRNPQTHCCIATINTITKAEFPINTSVAIGSNQILTTYRPKATASATMFFGNSVLVLSKNSINEALALTAITSPVPSGMAIEFQIEWHYV